MSKEEFKNFAKVHPELVNFVTNGDMTWQKFYEMYDIYGEEDRVWKKYLQNDSSLSGMDTIKSIIKNIDTDSIQKHINTAQKAIGVVQELTNKPSEVITKVKGPINPRPLNKFFED